MPDATLSRAVSKVATARTKTLVKLDPAVITGIVPVIARKHSELGGDAGFLGVDKTGDQHAANGGLFREYAGGVIYWSSETGAHEVHGAILALWTSLGRENGFLGYPLTDESTTPDGVGRFNHFQGGSIYWTPATGAHEVHGAILDLWAGMGWETSFLGYPLTDELHTADGVGRFTDFQGGQIAWSPDLGAAVSAVFAAAYEGGHPGLKPLSHDHPEEKSPQVRRRLSVSAGMAITDHENFVSNEHGSAQDTENKVVSNDVPSAVMTLVGKAGGEVRVELELTGRAKDNGDVLVDGVTTLYEGDSAETDDEDARETFQVLVPRDSFASQDVHIVNSGLGGGDFADIKMDFNNSAV